MLTVLIRPAIIIQVADVMICFSISASVMLNLEETGLIPMKKHHVLAKVNSRHFSTHRSPACHIDQQS